VPVLYVYCALQCLFLTSLARNSPRSLEEGELKNKYFGMMSLKWQELTFFRPQKINSKGTTTGTVIVTGSAKPISCIRIRQANFPGTRDRQWVSVGYTDYGDILLQINYARHVPALKIAQRRRHCFPPKFWSYMPCLNVPFSLTV